MSARTISIFVRRGTVNSRSRVGPGRMLAINRNPLQTVIGQNEPTQNFLGIANVL